MPHLIKTLVFVAALYIPFAAAINMPPKNPYLADSSNSMAHGDPAQQDSVRQRGPSGPTRTLAEEEIQYQHVGPAHMGAATSGVYADGRRVFWNNGLDRIVKMDFETYEVLDEYSFPGADQYSEQQADTSIASFDKSNDGKVSREEFTGPAPRFPILDHNNDGVISGDEIPSGPKR